MARLDAVARAIGGTLHGGDVDFDGVTQDTRTLARGDLYVALSGENFDGHDFVRRAANLGAAAALVERHIDCALPQVEVADSLAGLQAMAAAHRQQLATPVIAVTGSNGKTTVKQMLASIFEQAGAVLATQGNLNNHIGLPLTLMRLRDKHRFAVIEMGANHIGEIAALCQIAKPNIGIVTQASGAHLEGFGSLQGIVEAKGELFSGLADDGIAIINADDPAADQWLAMAAPRRVLRFGLHAADADVAVEDLTAHPSHSEVQARTPLGSLRFELRLPGQHNVANALAAAAAGIAAGLQLEDIAAGLQAVKPPAGRLSFRTAESGARLRDDTYNANPTSLRAALAVLAQQPGEHWLVLGDMLELGADSDAEHEQAGREAAASGVTRLFTLGGGAANAAAAFGEGAKTFDDHSALIDALRAALEQRNPADIVIAFKGSRGARMERCVEALMRPAQPEEAAA